MTGRNSAAPLVTVGTMAAAQRTPRPKVTGCQSAARHLLRRPAALGARVLHAGAVVGDVQELRVRLPVARVPAPYGRLVLVHERVAREPGMEAHHSLVLSMLPSA